MLPFGALTKKRPLDGFGTRRSNMDVLPWLVRFLKSLFYYRSGIASRWHTWHRWMTPTIYLSLYSFCWILCPVQFRISLGFDIGWNSSPFHGTFSTWAMGCPSICIEVANHPFHRIFGVLLWTQWSGRASLHQGRKGRKIPRIQGHHPPWSSLQPVRSLWSQQEQVWRIQSTRAFVGDQQWSIGHVGYLWIPLWANHPRISPSADWNS